LQFFTFLKRIHKVAKDHSFDYEGSNEVSR
jgi:hypothetical protein